MSHPNWIKASRYASDLPPIFNIISAPQGLSDYITSMVYIERWSLESKALTVVPNGVPVLVFHFNEGNQGIESIATASSRLANLPSVFLCGAGTEPSTMKFRGGNCITLQVIFQPHALRTLFGVDASSLVNKVIDLAEFSGRELCSRLIDVPTSHERVHLLAQFLTSQKELDYARDFEIEACIRHIDHSPEVATVKGLLGATSLSERQFEKRFRQTTGLSAAAYIRLKRFKKAIEMMKEAKSLSLTEIAHALNYYDQSHFIRDTKSFTGKTPRVIAGQLAGQLREVIAFEDSDR